MKSSALSSSPWFLESISVWPGENGSHLGRGGTGTYDRVYAVLGDKCPHGLNASCHPYSWSLKSPLAPLPPSLEPRDSLLTGTHQKLLITSHTAHHNFLCSRCGGAEPRKAPTGNSLGAVRGGCPGSHAALSSIEPAGRKQGPAEVFLFVFLKLDF